MNVAAPIRALAALAPYIWTGGTPVSISGASTAVAATSADAAPPNPLNAATSCGIAVIGTLSAKTAPIKPPMTIPAKISSKLMM